MRLRFTPPALAEIDEILTGIGSRSPRGAGKVRDRLEKIADSLRDHPYLGQATDIQPVRRLGLQPYPYILFYRIGETEVVIVGIRHAARDPGSMPGGENTDLP
ncbi:type II toxin-antitoxin system RelE/ParE family toxin [Aureimonas leprariae]|uniref:Type II toxin-antitoxin system RelE/ParE family toxin n=1 Tax=Plantimonas leprariae TaxID=2615207 RepID=A0A7V7TXF4_9HYPH|nr:type II toxin-antitoxin system RelE/ParE family toxin [Aureimonas leprariae]KAB0681281.1 type II toxin-antitoxin system RelE/ParE family toxin [Aureimonas leprariae]